MSIERRPLGRSGLTVPSVCLGTMTFGEQNTEAQGFEQMDAAFEAGIDFFDTAELYPIPPKAGTAGETERIIGAWLKARRLEGRVMIATKTVGRSQMTWFRGRQARLSPQDVRTGVEGSLKRLGVARIDLYQTHWPDRDVPLFGAPWQLPKTTDDVPIAETLGALADLKAEGKIGEIGVSNETPWGVAQHMAAADAGSGPRIVSIQNVYNLISRRFEDGLAEFAIREGVGLLAYSPLAQGYLTGKYEGGALPAGSRKALFDRLGRYEAPGSAPAISAYLALAREAGLDPTAMALAFVTARPFVTSNIIGATSLPQLRADIAGATMTLAPDVMEGIARIHAERPNPAA